MKIAVINLHNVEGPVEYVNAGISAIGSAIEMSGDTVTNYRNVDVMDDIDNILAQQYDAFIISLTDVSVIEPIFYRIHEVNPRIIMFLDGVDGTFDHKGLENLAVAYRMLQQSNAILVNSYANYLYMLEFLPKNKVHNIGLPVRVKYIIEHYKKLSIPQEPDLVWCGYISWRPHHNVLLALKVVNSLGLRGLVVPLECNKNVVAKILNTLGIKAVVEDAVDPPSYISKILKRCSLAVVCTTRESIGRTAAECAVVGIPCVGTRSYFQEELFPSLTRTRMYPHTLRNLIKSVCTEDMSAVLVHARKKVNAYTPSNYRNKLVKILMGG